ncbi:hypothetical protein BU24DRAFT_447376 [Aaosphaeria arxii CBS 175.79]|uniref:Zn(2)-C6 fungal-type domain-containing protein n=1 Tax=Aaosphaeria arxii CBS 175.79 TaxID=1450172 RepID=A0A6A5Y0I3_9PLEO|nr:uncharacterized protein BU24DRAFT_447376 [Aaosphaeria arxii CBS 175.79]KAF2018736.1 hypothetical protein BU24DRAFT_447376 [Aaosphaeria arxii CBS 175.79]
MLLRLPPLQLLTQLLLLSLPLPPSQTTNPPRLLSPPYLHLLQGSSHAPQHPRQESPQSLQNSPSTTQASPPSSARPVVPIASDSNRPVEPRRRPEQGGATRMRSSIACERCRRSKVKCNNNGAGTQCQACASSKRECIYPEPGTGSGRRESTLPSHPSSTSKSNGHVEAPPRKRQKRTIASLSQATPSNGSSPDLLDLDPHVLTPKVWKELFEIYQRHFASDLPFVHFGTFRKLLQQPNSNESLLRRSTPSCPNHYSELFLLAFLALTSRFHDGIVKHYDPPVYPNNSDPLLVAERYAEAARSRLHQVRDQHKMVERVQASLMLCLHEWGMCEGTKAWLSMHDAVGHAQLLGFYYEDTDKIHAPVHPINPNADFIAITQGHYGSQPDTGTSVEDSFVEQEIKRRTFWSCFIMDRYLSGGYMRPNQIRISDIHIQLPASDKAFAHGTSVTTSRLGGDEDDSNNPLANFSSYGYSNFGSSPATSHFSGVRNGSRHEDSRGHQHNGHDDGDKMEIQEVGESEGALSCYTRAISLYGEVMHWSCTGGRRRAQGGKFLPPWNERSEFFQLNNRLTEFRDGLPQDLRLCDANTTAHSDNKSSSHYILMHLALLLCDIMLHREWVPFLPFACIKPEGPLDEPLVREAPPPEYPNYWEDVARKCFKAARNIIDLLGTYQEWDSLVETPVSGFAMFQVGVCGIYCMFFPQMDPQGYMCRSQAERARRAISGEEGDLSDGELATRKAFDLLIQMQSRLKMARGWCRTLQNLGDFCKKKAKEFKRRQAVSSPDSSMNSNASEGAGLDEYKKLEKYLKGFYSLSELTGEEDKVLIEVAIHDIEKESDVGSEGQESKPPQPDGPPVWAAVNRTNKPEPVAEHHSLSSLAASDRFQDAKMGPYPHHPRFDRYNTHEMNSPSVHDTYNAYPNPSISADRETIGINSHIQSGMHSDLLQPQTHMQFATTDPAFQLGFAAVDVIQFQHGNVMPGPVPTRDTNWLEQIQVPLNLTPQQLRHLRQMQQHPQNQGWRGA